MSKKKEAKTQKKKRPSGYEGIENKSLTILNENSSFIVSEAYKTLRTNILFSTGNAGCKTFVITSAVPGEGKTTTAINIAISFAQTEKKVVIIDADLRKPKLHEYFELKNKVGVSNILSGVYEEKDTQYIQKTNVKNLDLISSGHIPPNPIELLSSDKMESFIKNLEESYDFIIIDTPPINIVSDALVLSKIVTGYIMVARGKYTEYHSLNVAMSNFELANIKPLGVVLNDFDRNQSSHNVGGKYYKYGYGYSYGKQNN